jgi:hypothetical protein
MNRKLLQTACFAAFICFLNLRSYGQNVGISDSGSTFVPSSVSVLELKANTRGLLLPRLGSRMASPVLGLAIYNQTKKSLDLYNGAAWFSIGYGGDRNFWAGSFTTQALDFTTTTGAADNVFLGYSAGTAATTAKRNVFIGASSGNTATTANDNTFVGYSAGSPSTGGANTFVGASSGLQNIGGVNNSYFGYQAGGLGTAVVNATMIGFQAGYNNTANDATSVGFQSGFSNTSGYGNVNLGWQAGFSNLTGIQNTMIGRQAGFSNTGSSCIYVGYNAGSNNATGTNNLIIGTAIGTPATTTNNYLNIGNVIIGDLSTKFVGINCATPAYQFHVNGDIASSATVRSTNTIVTGAITGCSDIRYKKQVKPLTNSLANILKLQGVNYLWKTEEFPAKNFSKSNQLGLIAQEVEKIYPELVLTDNDGYKSVDYGKLTPVLVEAIKDQQKQIDDLKKMVEQLMKK